MKIKWFVRLFVLSFSFANVASADEQPIPSRSDRISDTINAVVEQVQLREAGLDKSNVEPRSSGVSPETKAYLHKLEVQAKKPRPRIGMTERQVINGTNWGRPDSVNTTETASVIFEQWVYGEGQYLYFRNGRLSSMQY